MAWVNLSTAFGYGTILTSTQMQNLRDNIAAAFAKDSGAPVLANLYVVNAMMADGAIGEAELKTTTGEGSFDVPASSTIYITLPGGDYGLLGVKVKAELAASINFDGLEILSLSTSYQIVKASFSNGTGTDRFAYVQQRYIQASGEVFWYMFMRDKTTKEIIAQFSAPDHPCMMQNIPPEDYPHPWGDEFDPVLHEIIVINPDAIELENIRKLRATGNRTILEVIDQEYDIDDTVEPDWPSEPVTIGLPPDWADKPMGTKIVPVKEVIIKPAYTRTAQLKAK